MIKGWKLNPAWVQVKNEQKRERAQRAMLRQQLIMQKKQIDADIADAIQKVKP